MSAEQEYGVGKGDVCKGDAGHGSTGKSSADTAPQRNRRERSRNARIACVYIPQLGLQCLRREEEHLDFDARPHALVDAYRPSAPLLQLNACARRQGVRAGMRMRAAQSLCPGLNIHVQNTALLDVQRTELVRQLRAYSPHIERDSRWPDGFWLRGDGLSTLWASASHWAEAVYTELAMGGWHAAVVVGFSRAFSLGVARSHPGCVRVFRSPEEEREHASKVALRHLGIDVRLRERWARLGIETIGDLAQLPVGSVHRRYGAEAARWVRWVRAEVELPSRTVRPPRRFEAQAEWDIPVVRQTALLFALQEPISRVLAALQRAQLSCEVLHVSLELDWPDLCDDRILQRAKREGISVHEPLRVTLRAASAHTDVDRWNTLLRLRLAQIRLPTGVSSVWVRAEPTRVHARQENWENAGETARSEALGRALAHLRAELGEDAVGRLHLQDAHLPEARQGWKSMTHLVRPSPHPHYAPTMVRRMCVSPRWFSSRAQSEEVWTGPNTKGGGSEDVKRVGPYVIAGGWWHQKVERAYYYVWRKDGDVLWAFYDRVRGRWCVQGEVF